MSPFNWNISELLNKNPWKKSQTPVVICQGDQSYADKLFHLIRVESSEIFAPFQLPLLV